MLLYNSLGQLVLQQSLAVPDGTLGFNIKEQPAGLYYLQLSSDGNTIGKQLIKQ